MAPIRGNNLTAEQTADANLWLHKKEKMITDEKSLNQTQIIPLLIEN